ncbi:hypothetical protein BJ138DRAFT_1109961 [Hygrophoropsis aurantiaca]|uniref:Uncharacterized protein n=1 Tax=Hygrophoropsis aurantiaca TaxID=72124 RepID=A0ACB8APE4_9AGAM|nr:hypothetical protein BJ138DRAFT_1109961 [Hygrophoropsis aurantiaca]
MQFSLTFIALLATLTVGVCALPSGYKRDIEAAHSSGAVDYEIATFEKRAKHFDVLQTDAPIYMTFRRNTPGYIDEAEKPGETDAPGYYADEKKREVSSSPIDTPIYYDDYGKRASEAIHPGGVEYLLDVDAA